MLASSGIPGIGVLPGLKPFFICSADGIPGTGLLPIGKLTALTEIPGGIFADGGKGLADKPGGMFAGSIFISLGIMFESFVLDATFDGLPEPQPHKIKARPKSIARFLNI